MTERDPQPSACHHVGAAHEPRVAGRLGLGRVGATVREGPAADVLADAADGFDADLLLCLREAAVGQVAALQRAVGAAGTTVNTARLRSSSRCR